MRGLRKDSGSRTGRAGLRIVLGLGGGAFGLQRDLEVGSGVEVEVVGVAAVAVAVAVVGVVCLSECWSRLG